MRCLAALQAPQSHAFVAKSGQLILTNKNICLSGQLLNPIMRQMAETRINQWLAHLPQNGPRLASAVLAALIAVELGRIGLTLFGPKPVTPIMPAASATARVNPAINIQSLVDGHLFGIAEADATQSNPADAPTSSANFVLAGTIATADPKHGVAIIGDGGSTRVYSVGQTIGSYTLHSVYLDRVLLDRGGGALEALLLPKLPPVGGVVQPAAYNNANGADSQAAIVNNLRSMVAHDPDMLKEVIRTVPSFDAKAHKLKGFRVYPGRNPQSFAKLGLVAGDIIVAVNGSPLDDMSRNQELLNVIQGSSTATLTIEHLGKRKDMTLNVAQVAEQAARELSNEQSNPAPPIGAEPPPINDDTNY
jgi:general secretion pathway protein C